MKSAKRNMQKRAKSTEFDLERAKALLASFQAKGMPASRVTAEVERLERDVANAKYWAGKK
jgi:hypothetical protein